MKVIVEEIKKKYSPILVNFENGNIIDGQELKLKPKVYKNQDNKKTIVIPSDRIIYTGDVEHDNDLQNYFLIHNKITNKARLVPLSTATVKPYLRQSKTSSSLIKLTKADLNKHFGSKRSKRIVEERERHKTDFNTIKNELEETVAVMQTDNFFLNKLEISNTDSVLKPPINRNATIKEDVYQLNLLVPMEVLKELKPEVQAILSADDLSEFSLKEFTKTHIEKLKAQEYSKAVQLKCKILLYINYMVTFLNTAIKTMNKKFILCKSAPLVNSHILDNFTVMTGGNRNRPSSYRDKGVCYVLVLATLATDYEFDLQPLSKDLKLGIKKLQEMCRVLALTPTKTTSVCLKLPLPAPVVHSEGKRR